MPGPPAEAYRVRVSSPSSEVENLVTSPEVERGVVVLSEGVEPSCSRLEGAALSTSESVARSVVSPFRQRHAERCAWRESNPRCRYGKPECHHNTSGARGASCGNRTRFAGLEDRCLTVRPSSRCMGLVRFTLSHADEREHRSRALVAALSRNPETKAPSSCRESNPIRALTKGVHVLRATGALRSARCAFATAFRSGGDAGS